MATKKRQAVESVRSAIAELDLSQNALEEHLGMGRGSLSHLLRERQSVGLFGALALANALGIEPKQWLPERLRKRLDKITRLAPKAAA